MPGVYISYPFCNQKCTFCNFASGVASRERSSLYEQALLSEIRHHQWEWLPETVYLGGGTPSLLQPCVLTEILAAIPSREIVEVTLECAPGTLTRDRVARWANFGVNRVSLGVQSFDATELRYSGRRHTAEVVASDLEMLRSGGITNINLDLIAGLPHQTRESWANSLDWIARLSPPHVSVYLFEVDEDSRLGKEILTGGTRYSAGFLPSEEAAADFYERAVDYFARLGYRRYEISNFARPGFASVHNLKYWHLEPYVGFGLDAHSYDGTFRWGNPDSLDDYLKRLELTDGAPERQRVDKVEERFFVGLRLMDGIRPTAAEWNRFASPIHKWTDLGMLELDNGALRLSPKGVLISNEIFQEFLND
ncbi:MAG: radical SAM family heme chaperone HemW [Bryobacteraceae bacterium]